MVIMKINDIHEIHNKWVAFPIKAIVKMKANSLKILSQLWKYYEHIISYYNLIKLQILLLIMN